MLLSIIIVNYKTKNMVKECIKNILDLNLEFAYEIIVVDNNSKDNIQEMIEEDFQDVKLIQLSKNKGMGAGNNLGAKQAKGEYLLILNPDVVVLPGAIEKLLQKIQNNQQIGCVAPMLLNPDFSYQQSRYRFPRFLLLPVFIRTGLGRFAQTKLDRYFMSDTPYNQEHAIDWARGSALLVKKNLFHQVKGFDERFFMYLEDTDLCKKIWQADKKVWYQPESKMIHYYYRQSGGGQWLMDLWRKLAWIHIYSWFKYFYKWRKEK